MAAQSLSLFGHELPARGDLTWDNPNSERSVPASRRRLCAQAVRQEGNFLADADTDAIIQETAEGCIRGLLLQQKPRW